MNKRRAGDAAPTADAGRAASERARREREAGALRENLLKRKAQARARRDAGAPEAPAAPDAGKGQ